MSIADEPLYGYLLAGEYPEKLLYERCDSVTDIPERWFNVADEDDIYTFDDLVKDYPRLVWLTSADE